MKDSEVLDRIARGDESALEFLYKKYYRMMTKMVISNNGTEDEARDIYQDALIVFWEKARSLRNRLWGKRPKRPGHGEPV